MRLRRRARCAGRPRSHGRRGAVAGALSGRRKLADGIRSSLGRDPTPDRARGWARAGGIGGCAPRRVLARSTRAARAANGDCGAGRAGGHECVMGRLALRMRSARSAGLAFPWWASLRRLALISGALLSACANVVPPASDIRAAGAVESAFIVVGAGGARLARLITTDDACPAIAVDDLTTPTKERGGPATGDCAISGKH